MPTRRRYRISWAFVDTSVRDDGNRTTPQARTVDTIATAVEVAREAARTPHLMWGPILDVIVERAPTQHELDVFFRAGIKLEVSRERAR